jgi:hypothetical protein
MLAALLGEVPALPLHTAGKYVAGAYIVLFVIVLIYVAIMGVRLSRIERDLGALLSMSEAADPTASSSTGEHSRGDTGRQGQQPESTLA